MGLEVTHFIVQMVTGLITNEWAIATICLSHPSNPTGKMFAET